MPTKIIKITNCVGCPFLKNCELGKKSKEELPKDCPLEDYISPKEIEEIESNAFQAGVNEVYSQMNGK